jgi:crotonobetainyl-CoA:carnitine CoA-transferase CaiB-like acyl-CoA transferase
MLLAMHGAEVVKLEPLAGDWSRGLGTRCHRGTIPDTAKTGDPAWVDVALPPAPRIGEHGAGILAENGIDPAAIARLREENVLLIPKAS